MVWKDLDATPRVLRVRNPDLSEAEASVSSRNTSAKTRSFSIRSISGSWSSIWGRESTSRSHTDFSQGSASYGCVPFPSLLSNHHTAIQHPHKRFPIDGESKPLTSRSDASSISRLPSTHHTIHNHKTACRPISSIHRPDKRLAKPLALLEQSEPSLRIRKTSLSKPNPKGIFRRVFSRVMASNTNLPADLPHDDELPITEPLPSQPLMRPVMANYPSINGMLGSHRLETGESSTYAACRPPLNNATTEILSGRTSPNTVMSNRTQATSYSGMFRNPGPQFYELLNPNPLLVPPPSIYSGPPSISASKASLIRQELTKFNGARLPSIGALNVETYSFAVLENASRYRATAYAIFDIAAYEQNAFHYHSSVNPHIPGPPYSVVQNYPGFLRDLSIDISVIGPAVKVTHIGLPSLSYLNNLDRWVVVVYLKINDTSLSSRLSTSMRSKEQSVSRSERSPAMALVDHFLDVLKTDKEDEPVVVSAVIKYRHAFLPTDTKLETRAAMAIDVRAEVETGAMKQAVCADYNEVATAILSVLDPGLDDLVLSTVRPSSHQQYPVIAAADGLRLLQDFHGLFGFGNAGYVNLDLGALEGYYLDAVKDEPSARKSASLVRSLRLGARTVVKKLSPKKN
ncbi:hypothetical protein PV05_09086 [Exophiala xenobiotica]|uniref:Uncharacterized protein n=1 Tax=Exophiala xenobiotica TaxID=348802 RepID=A0A0D2EG01_9EURO|nr:uncharacterized protein PV05_09086 [Exophiala xenobiotica]KIW53520.1 hypothetical protein PV05_09086 [Exophiala xenobiotica]